MQITDLLRQTGGLGAIAHELGISEADAARGASALAPAILGGFKKQTQGAADGGAGLGALVGQLGGASLLDDVVSPEATNVERGNGVLGRIFGSKDVSREIVADASVQSGLDEGLLKRMLPRLAMLIAGYMGSQARAASGESSRRRELGVLLSGLVGRGTGGPPSGLASILELAGDGNPLDDILGKRARQARER